MAKKKKYKPCPFCGEKNNLHELSYLDVDGKNDTVVCDKCGAMASIELWDKRVGNVK